MNSNEVLFRLLRSNDLPATNPHNLVYRFGLQDTKGNVVTGTTRSDGMICFDFSLKVKEVPDSERPVFTGQFSSGPVNDRFVYLSWWAIDRKHWINRIKARLTTIDWTLVRTSQEQGRRISADMSNRGPGETERFVPWYLD